MNEEKKPRKRSTPGASKIPANTSKKRPAETASVNDVAAAPAKPTKPAPQRQSSRARKAAAAPSVSPGSAVEPTSPAPAIPGLSILMVTSESHPFAKTGGLAEVSAALSDALAAMGHHVAIALPRYGWIAADDGERLQTRLRFGNRLQPVTIIERVLSERLKVAFIDVPELFDREGLYGTAAGDYPDNAWRFAVFSRAALEYARMREWRPSIIHAHDWQTGLVPVYQKMQLSSDPFVGGVPVVFTLHNLAFQGLFPVSTLAEVGLGLEVLDVQGLEFWGNISYLKGGINFSEKITTVSPGYAREIVQPELGFGFEGILARRSADLVGILNGIDTSRWNPAGDPFVPASFTADDLAGKREAKRALLATVGLPSDDEALATPVIGLVSRLTDQKGFDLIAASSDELMKLDARWVMLGNGERRYEEGWRAFAARYPGKVSAHIGFDERLAHYIEAGSDLFLMPSRFEPCGLNQLYSLRYGTVPIVRATGGLNDTVEDASSAPETGTGFKFRDYTPQALVDAVRRAISAFKDADGWKTLQQRGMRMDHSWHASAAEYVKVYAAMLQA
jgi:starch synthase